MKRRTFIQRLTALSLIAGPASASQPARHHTPLLLQQSPIAGTFYHQANAVADQIPENARLRLQREPHNPHDPRAVAIHWNTYKLGYLPRRDSAAVSQLLDRAIALETRLIHNIPHPDPWRQMKIAIYLP